MPRASASSLAKMALASPSASIRLRSAAASASTITWAFLALATASSWARCSASTFSAWASAALVWARKAASSTPASASRFLVSPIWKASACRTARSAFEAATFALDSFSPPIACASASASLMRISRSASLTLACCSKAAVSTPIFSSFSSSATRTARSRSAAFVPISRRLLGVGDLDRLELLGLGDADRPVFLLLGDVDLGLVDRRAGGLAADRLDVARVVGQVGDVDVDQHQADLAELHLQRVLDVLQELLAIAVDLVDGHRRDHLAELAEDQVGRLGADLLAGEVQQADRGVLHHLGLGADGDGEDARHVHPDVLEQERPRRGISIWIGSRER